MGQHPYLQLLTSTPNEGGAVGDGSKRGGPRKNETPIEAAFRENARYVHAVALRILGSVAEVEDVLQDLFLAAQRDLRELEHPAAVRRWFLVATVRLARRRLHRQRIFSFFSDQEREVDAAVAPDASPEQWASLSSIYRVLDRVPVGSRLAWTLRHIEGFSLEEVAQLCNCSLATAKRRINVAHELVTEVAGEPSDGGGLS